jgi:transposase
MAIALPDARQLSDEVIQALRLRALHGCELGHSEAEMAELLGVAPETVSRWWCAYADAGLDALPGERTGRPPGSGRTLTDAQGARLQQLIDNHSPEALGIPAPLWSRAAVRDLIRSECGVEMPVRTVGEYLRRWGYTAKRPARHHRDQDPKEIDEWRTTTYPALEAKAREEFAEIHWCDETGVAADEHPHLGYSKAGTPARIEVPDPHLRVNVVSTVTQEGEVRFMTYTRTMTGTLFVQFLEQLLLSTGRKIYLIADRLSAHTAGNVATWLAERRDRIELVHCPRRSPELNPDECLNNDLKGNVHRAALPGTRRELLTEVQTFLEELRRTPARVMGYFELPSTQYASAH